MGKNSNSWRDPPQAAGLARGAAREARRLRRSGPGGSKGSPSLERRGPLRKNIPPSERELLGMRYVGLAKAAALPEAAASWYGEGRASTLVFSRCTPPARHSERERGRYESRDSVPHAREGGVRLSPWVVAGIAAGRGRRLGPPRAIMAVDNRRGVGGDSCRIPGGSSFE